MTWARTSLRAAAIAIAMAAVLDPAITREVVRPGAVTVVAAGTDAWSGALGLRDRFADAGATAWLHQEGASAAACPATGACIIVSRANVPPRVSAGADVVGVVQVAPAGDAITQIDAPARVHRSAVAALRVSTTRVVERIDVFDQGVLVGSAEPDGATDVEVPWVPVDAGARLLRVEAGDAVASAAVVVDEGAVPVVFFEPQASWLGTFVRRALEDDPRFDLRGRTRVAPSIAVSRGGATTLTAAALENVGTVVLTTPAAVTPGDVTLLQRFVAERGGSLVVLADERPDGAVARLLPRVASEERAAEARDVGPLRASEWLTFVPGDGLVTLASVDDQPVIAARPVGRGQVIVSGALDTWRYRDGSARFTAFWTTLVWDAAVVAGPSLRVDVDRVAARPGESIDISAAVAEMTPAGEFNADGRAECGDQRHPLRLWPDGRPGSFHATLRVDAPGDCTVSVRINGREGSTPVTIRDDFERLAADHEQLEAVAAAYGGVYVAASDNAAMDELVARVAARTASDRESTSTRPMRSPLWLVPFVVALGGEWWLRRRSGLS